MSTLSPLQALPPHVAKLIVNHVVGSSRLVYGGVRVNSYAHRSLLRPLLWVCHNFRAIALPLYCSHFKLFIYSDSPDVLDIRNLLPRNAIVDYRECNYLGHPTHHLARELGIVLDKRAVYSGKALRMLSTEPYDGSPFLQARKLALIFVPDEMDETGEDIDTDPLTVETNVAAFVQRVKQMAPKVSEIRVQPAYDGDMEIYERKTIKGDHRFSDLVSRLFQLVSSIGYGLVNSYSLPIELRPDNICNLVHMKFDSMAWVDDTRQFIRLARQNAQTLQSLCIVSWKEEVDVASLVQYADNRLVTYPGNAATLEVLEMDLTLSMISMLRKYSVFTPASHPKLQCVNIWCNDRLTPDAFASIAEITQFALSIGPEAPVRVLSGVYSVNELLPSLSSHGRHSPIQVLSLNGIALELPDAITLIKSLPLLTDLHAKSLAYGPAPASAAMAHSCASSTPISKRLRCLLFAHPMRGHCADSVVCVLLLALVCPSLGYAVPANYSNKLFMKLIEMHIASDMFKPYALRLQRLLIY
ncbi:hypothetical protein GGF42_005742 [Coemansia sp. RSA 2424]|nr:hypothetical protein GGF42_005742 [Coemansia sp. RSA 2424]